MNKYNPSNIKLIADKIYLAATKLDILKKTDYKDLLNVSINFDSSVENSVNIDCKVLDYGESDLAMYLHSVLTSILIKQINLLTTELENCLKIYIENEKKFATKI